MDSNEQNKKSELQQIVGECENLTNKFGEILKEIDDRSFYFAITCLEMDDKQLSVHMGKAGGLENIVKTIVELMEQNDYLEKVIMSIASQFALQKAAGLVCNCPKCQARRNLQKKHLN